MKQFSIKPYERFSNKISSQELINQFDWNFHYFFKKRNDTIIDLLYNKPILYKNRKNKELKVFNRNDITMKDSITMSLYLNVYTYNFNHHMVVESNPVSLPYKDVINLLIEREKQKKPNR